MKKKPFLWSPPAIRFLPLVLMILLTGCEKEAVPEIENAVYELQAAEKKLKNNKIIEFYGPAERFNNGVVRSMVQMDKNGVPEAIGIRISEKALDDLPHHNIVSSLELSNKAANMAFDHIDFDWNPEGHEPAGLYTIPHFDIHFYMVSEEYKQGITDPQKGIDYPDDIYRPVNYSPPPDIVPAEFQLVPQMGVHWTRNDEPQEFTHTFIYGSYDNSFIFLEPMVTRDYLLNEADGQLFEIAQPEKFEREGYYPTQYSMYYDAKKKDYVILMSGMVWREAYTL